MKRREFITLFGGAAAAWPLAARAQQRAHIRRLGVLSGYSESDPDARARLAGFQQGIKELGWIEGRTLHTEYRWSRGDSDRARTLARELVELQP
jgi:putative ABC transport system substrate-binding protein